MTNKTLLALILYMVFFLTGFWLGSALLAKLHACAKQHNVYRCEIVAVPVRDK